MGVSLLILSKYLIFLNVSALISKKALQRWGEVVLNNY